MICTVLSHLSRIALKLSMPKTKSKARSTWRR